VTLALHRDVTVSEVDGGLVLLDQRNGRYWHLNETAGTMLRHLLDGRSPDETAAQLAGTNNNLRTRIAADVATLVDGLHRAKLVAS
jgi:Coenzyme PQQ synthesis protein D (PqqD)